jgi:hypothetical protein
MGNTVRLVFESDEEKMSFEMIANGVPDGEGAEVAHALVAAFDAIGEHIGRTTPPNLKGPGQG